MSIGKVAQNQTGGGDREGAELFSRSKNISFHASPPPKHAGPGALPLQLAYRGGGEFTDFFVSLPFLSTLDVARAKSSGVSRNGKQTETFPGRLLF